jgi:hypothetical protein
VRYYSYSNYKIANNHFALLSDNLKSCFHVSGIISSNIFIIGLDIDLFVFDLSLFTPRFISLYVSYRYE